jgi:hypothetical protein
MQADAALFETLLLAAIVVARDDPRRGVALQSAGRALAAARGYEISAKELELADEALARARAVLDEPAFAEESSKGAQLSRDAALELALQSLD